MSGRVFAALALLWPCGLAAAADSPTVSTEIRLPANTTALPEPTTPDAASLAEGYFALGNWRIGMPRDAALKLFADAVAIEGDDAYRATAHTLRPGSARGNPLRRGQAPDREAAGLPGHGFRGGVQRMQSALLYMNEHFGGANFEGGLKTWKDPRGELLGQVLKQSIEQMEHGARGRRKRSQEEAPGRAGDPHCPTKW